MCDTVAVLRGGQVVETGPTAEVYANPQQDYTRDLLAAVPTLERSLALALARQRAADEGDAVTDPTMNGGSAPEPDVEAAVELTRQLVRLRTVNDPASATVEEPAARLLSDLMRGFGWHVTIEDVVPGRPNVVAVVDGDRPGRTLMFEGHTDVVTEGDRSDWSFPPFVGDIVDGRLRGRGSADMKSGVAAMIHAVRAVELGGFAGRIIVAALADEEGMMLGVKDFAGSPLAASGIDGVIVCEPEGGEICCVAKGAIRVRIDFTGKMAHGAMPQHGRSPIPAIGSAADRAGRAAGRRSRPRSDRHQHLGDFYLTPTVLSAGSSEQVNVIPATASVYLDIRTIPSVGHPALLAPGDEAGREDRRRRRDSIVEVERDRRPAAGGHAGRCSGRRGAGGGPRADHRLGRRCSAGCPAPPTAPSCSATPA